LLLNQLFGCSFLAMLKLPVNSLHHFWNEEPDDSTAKSVFGTVYCSSPSYYSETREKILYNGKDIIIRLAVKT